MCSGKRPELPGSFDCLGERGHAVKAAAGAVAGRSASPALTTPRRAVRGDRRSAVTAYPLDDGLLPLVGLLDFEPVRGVALRTRHR